jgi:tRNA A-37 threonylcarbamoyl transferase component Bud32
MRTGRSVRRIGGRPGDVVTAPARIGSYQVERLLGTGSFATVWLGHDPTLGARVAIKVLADNWSHDLRIRERFLDEGRMLWRLDHDRIVRVHALGELADGRPYLVMAWADGGSLRERLEAGPVSPGAALHLLGEIAAGVAVLHRHGIVHRDLSPGNILFRSRPGGAGTPEQVVVADLGLAKSLAAASGLTARAGTPGYMAPEQDDPFAIVDTRADVYGLGRLGLRLLAEPATARSGTDVRLRDGVPGKVRTVLRTATARQPADRYPDAAAFGAALAAAGGGVAPGRRRVRVAAMGVVAAAMLTGLASDAPSSGSWAGPGAAIDPTGRITVTLPDGWQAAGSGWAGRVDADGDPDPALVLSPEPDRWASDPGMPGAFVGLSRDLAASTAPADFVADRAPADCTPAPVRRVRRGGIDWVVATFTGCPDGKPVIVESAGVGPGGAGLVYVQIAPPAGSGTAFVDALLAGVRVR